MLKLSPDALDEDIRETISFAERMDIDGIVATNTTIKRPIPLSTQSRKAFFRAREWWFKWTASTRKRDRGYP